MLHISKFVQNLKEGYAAENQGWRQAIAEKAKRELGAKEVELRSQLTSERDAQIELVRSVLVHGHIQYLLVACSWQKAWQGLTTLQGARLLHMWDSTQRCLHCALPMHCR